MLGVLLIAGAFLVGSIPFGLLVGRVFFNVDLRTQGSGNIGAANALRSLGRWGALGVLLLDVAKGLLPVFLAARLGGPLLATLAGVAAMLGHTYSPWLGWRGGKGVATGLGACFGLAWPVGIGFVLAWIAGAALTRYSSVGSLAGAAVAPIALWIGTHDLVLSGFGLFFFLFVVYTHRENLDRLRKGTENPLGLFARLGGS